MKQTDTNVTVGVPDKGQKSQKFWLRIPEMSWRIMYVYGHSLPFADSRRALVSYWRKNGHWVLVNHLVDISLPRKSVVRLTDRPAMTIGHYATIQQQQQHPPVSVPISVNQSAICFQRITWVFIHGISLNFAYTFVSGMSGLGLLVGRIHQFLTALQPFLMSVKWRLACNSITRWNFTDV